MPSIHLPEGSWLSTASLAMGKTARQMNRSDYDRFDLLIGMDEWNIRNMTRICGGDPEDKMYLLADFTDRPEEVADLIRATSPLGAMSSRGCEGDK